MSSGSCWPSASRVTTASQRPSARRRANAVASAAPLPRFSLWRTTSAPACRARSAVSSVEPSSTTRTLGACRRAAAMTGSIVVDALSAGMTTASAGSGVATLRGHVLGETLDRGQDAPPLGDVGDLEPVLLLETDHEL